MGYGKTFAQSIFGDWGPREFEDMMAGMDAVIQKGYVDPEKIGVGGHSYGAILTNYIITHTTRFHAAITDAGESNYLVDYGVDQYLLEWEIAIGNPWEKPEHSYHLSRVLASKGIHHHLDDWGDQGGHDWPYWKHQMWHYLREV